MKAFLLYQGQDFDVDQPAPFGADDLIQDLHLTTVLDAVGGGDEFLTDVARRVMLTSLTGVDQIRYRQDILRDCLAHPDVVRDLYAVAVDAIQGEKKIFLGYVSRSPDLILHHAVAVLDVLVGMLRRLRAITDEHADQFRSAGFTALFTMIKRQLDDAYLMIVDEHLRQLRFRDGVLVSAALGTGGKGRHYVLRRALHRPGWWQRLTATAPDSYTYRIPERDENGARAVGELRDRGVNLVANALAQSNDHILAFFTMLRFELAFYVGCLNLHDRLAGLGAASCLPEPLPVDNSGLDADGLYDLGLALEAPGTGVVPNDVAAADTDLLVITGANQGGKSTLLRAVGLAYLMMQSGLFVAARRLRAGVRTGVFTHFKREEDAEMTSGKLDEELARMAGIADHLTAGGLVLCNESFAATNEREGSEINRQIIRALRERRVAVVTVTHLYDLASSLFAAGTERAAFLRAERRDDGRRTFKVLPGEPLPTSYGADLYRQVFGDQPVAQQAAA